MQLNDECESETVNLKSLENRTETQMSRHRHRKYRCSECLFFLSLALPWYIYYTCSHEYGYVLAISEGFFHIHHPA